VNFAPIGRAHRPAAIEPTAVAISLRSDAISASVMTHDGSGSPRRWP